MKSEDSAADFGLDYELSMSAITSAKKDSRNIVEFADEKILADIWLYDPSVI